MKSFSSPLASPSSSALLSASISTCIPQPWKVHISHIRPRTRESHLRPRCVFMDIDLSIATLYFPECSLHTSLRSMDENWPFQPGHTSPFIRPLSSLSHFSQYKYMSVYVHMSCLSHIYLYARVKFCVYLGSVRQREDTTACDKTVTGTCT